MNAYIRTKWTLTEDAPIIKAYNQNYWSNLKDSTTTPVEISLQLITALHQRWVILLKTLTENDLKKKYIHPEYKREFQLDEMLALYAWHGKQHYAHLKIILDNK